MRKNFTFSLLLLLVLNSVCGQHLNEVFISESDYYQLKKNGGLDKNSVYFFNTEAANKTGYFPADNSFVEAIPSSDDGSSSLITLPFDFCFFGDAETEVYINNNGNLSFGNPFSTSTALNFPFNNFKIIAPFWADVDTRKKGKVYYKLTSSALIVNWVDVGHFDQDTIRGNTFQVILTNGIDPILPSGTNLAFYYDNIEWTAGDASGGVNGFGGATAAVGINKGNNTDFVQIGRFDSPTNTYDGPFNDPDGAYWLTDRSIYMNLCSTDNVPPIFSGVGLKDTINVCEGDPIDLKIEVLSPEANQSTSIVANLNGFSNGSLIQNTSGNIALYEYLVNSTNGLQGTYDFAFGAYDNGTPSKTSNFNITVQIGAALSSVPSIQGENRVCGGNEIPIKVVPNSFSSYLWSTGETSDSIVVGAGNYKVTISEGICEKVVSYSITEDNFQPEIIGPNFICPGDSFQLNVTEAINDSLYLWDNGDTASSTFFFNDGMHYITITEKGNCIGIDSFYVGVLGVDPFEITASSDTSCNGELVTLSTGFEFDSILWNTLETESKIKVSDGGYFVGVGQLANDGSFCFDVDSIEIEAHNYPSLSISGDTFFCAGSSTLLEVDSTYDAYLWDNSIAAQQALYLTPGNHSVRIQSASCYDSLNFTVEEIPIPNPVITGNDYFCPGGDSAVLNAGFGWDSVLWSTGSSAPFVNVINGTYSLTAFKDGCSGTTTHEVSILSGTIEIQGDTVLCPDGTILNAGIGFDSYLWSNGDTTRLTTKLGPGSYSVTVTMGTCSAVSDTVIIDPNSLVSVNIVGDTLQCGGQGGVIYVPDGYLDYLWNTGADGAGIIVSSAGTYFVTVNDTNGCEIVDSVEVLINPSPIPVIQGESFYCNNDSVVLSVDSFPTILWSTGDTVQNVTVKKGTYSVVVTDSIGCIGTDVNFVVNQGVPKANITGDTLACESDTLTFYANSNDSVVWFNGVVDDSITVNNLNVSLTAIDTFGCENDFSYSVQAKVSPISDFSISPENSQLPGGQVIFTDLSSVSSGSLTDWSWSFGDGNSESIQNAIHVFASGGIYDISLTVTSDIGCKNTKTIPYEIVATIEAVNVMTPNGDFINDYLEFKGIELYPNSKLQVFNRWGEMIYEDDNYRNNWDGYFVEDGTYFYILELGNDGTVLKGTFLLTR